MKRTKKSPPTRSLDLAPDRLLSSRPRLHYETNFTQAEDELIKEQEKRDKKERKKEKENQTNKTKAQGQAEEVKEDEEDLKSKETGAATMEDTKKGGLLSRVFRRKSVGLQ